MNPIDAPRNSGSESQQRAPDHPRLGSEPPTNPRGKPDGNLFTFNRSLFLALGIALLFAPWAVEYLIGRYHRAATRARLMAEYEFAVENIAQQSTPLREISMGSQMVFRKIRPSVVSIQSQNTSDIYKPRAQGSGIAISSDGYIVTNYHVIKNFDRVYVEIEGRRRLVAEIIGGDELTDLAVIKVDADDLIPAEWGDSDLLQVGSMVWAIGSPFGLQNSVTSGIISSTERHGEDNPYQEFLQTDAAVNPGNSGGPLVDENGRVVGINTLIYGNRYQGISFAVPSALARKICDSIIKHGRFVRGYLGVRPGRILQHDMERLGLPDTSGALLEVVEEDTPADGAGLRVDDVIRKWDDKPISNEQLLFREVGLTPPGSFVNVSLIRDGQEQSVRVHVGRAPSRGDRE